MSGEGRRDTLVPYVLDALEQSHARFTLREPFRIRRMRTPELIRLAFRFARELEARGLGKGDRNLVWGHALPEWVADTGTRIDEMQSTDDSLQSLFASLLRIHRGGLS